MTVRSVRRNGCHVEDGFEDLVSDGSGPGAQVGEEVGDDSQGGVCGGEARRGARLQVEKGLSGNTKDGVRADANVANPARR